MYKCKHFKMAELVDQKTLRETSEWKLWYAFDQRILKVIDFLREELNSPITINDWSWGGQYKESGLRFPYMKVYSQFSQHSFGRALDCKFKNFSAEEVRQKIKKLMEDGKFKDITDTITCEADVSWVHIDVRNNLPGFNLFKV